MEKPAPKPSVPKKFRILASLVPILTVMTVISTVYLFHWKSQYGRLAVEKRGRILTLPLLERARELIERAEKYNRLPDPDEHRFVEVQGLAQEAMEVASQVLEKVADSEEGYRLRGRALELMYNLGEAQQDYLDAIQRHPESPARYSLGALATRILARARLAEMKTSLLPAEKLVDEASEPLRRYRAPSPEFLVRTKGVGEEAPFIDQKFRALCTLMNAYAYGDFEQVPTDAAAATLYDSTEWVAPYYLGLAFFERKDYRRAAEALERAARAAPAVADIRAWLGLALHRLGRKTDGISELTRAIAADPHFLEAYFVRGTLRHEEALFEDSREDFKTCAQLRPTIPEVQLKLGIAAFEYWDRTGRKTPADLDTAEAALSRYLESGPKDAEALRIRARVRIGRRETDKAQADLAAAIALAPQSPEPHEILAALYESGEKWDLAEKEHGIVMDKAPGTPQSLVAQLGRARIRARAGRADEAISDYDALLARETNDTFLLEKSAVQLRAGRPDDARATVEKALELNPRNARALARKAEILLEKGDADGAADEAAKAYRADPQLADSLVIRGKAFLKKGLKAEAAADWRDAIRLRKDLEPVLQPLIAEAEKR